MLQRNYPCAVPENAHFPIRNNTSFFPDFYKVKGTSNDVPFTLQYKILS